MKKTIGAISLYGSGREIEAAEEALNELDTGLSEGEIRPLIQEIMEHRKLKADILYDGNSVWSKQRIIRNLRQIIKAGVLYQEDKPRYTGKTILSKYFYGFLHLCCGSIAHYNINGWVAEYPTVEDLRAFFQKNEFGHRVLDDIPKWKTDVKIIVREIETILGHACHD